MLAAAAAMAPCAGSAQLGTGIAGFSDAPRSADLTEYWAFMHELGTCLAKSKRVQAAAYLATPPGSGAERTAFATLFRSNGNNVCMRDMISARLGHTQVRGVLAEGLYELRPATTPAASTSPSSDVRSMQDFADCFVANHRSDAHLLLAETRLGTTGERERVTALAPKFGPCLPEGQDMQIAPTNLRLAIAGALYRTVSRPAAVNKAVN